MATIELNKDELERYRAAIDSDQGNMHPAVSTQCNECCKSILERRGIRGYPDKVTVTFNHGSPQHLFELHYTDAG